MEEDDYVETSDVEELGDVYGQLGAPNHAGVGVGPMAERQLTSGRVPTPESDGHAYETLRKRRKVCGKLFWRRGYAEVWLAQPSSS